MNFGENLLKYANSIKISSQKELAKKLQESEKTVSAYITKRSCPTYKKMIKICNILQCDPNTLMKGDFKTEPTGIESRLNPEDQNLIDKYKSISPHDREIVDYILDMEDKESAKIYRFPVFYQGVAAGIGRLSETEEYHMEEFELKSMPKEAVFGMYIKGHSMEPNLFENDVVLIDPSVKVSNNLEDKIVVALFGEELICKRFSVNVDDQTYDFTSDNPGDKDKGRFHQKQSDFKLVGKVVKVIHVHEIGNGIFNYSDD